MSTKTKILKNFGKQVRSVRETQGFSQEAFAAKCKLHRTYYGAVERGEQNISLKNIQKIARALGVDVKDLF